MKNVLSFFVKSKVLLVWIQLGLSGVALGALSWTVTSSLKPLIVQSSQRDLYPWSAIFYHPVEGNRLDYMVTCIVLATCTFFLYLPKTEKVLAFMRRKADKVPFSILYAALLLSMILLLFLPSMASAVGRIAVSALITCVPILIGQLGRYL